jgi:predicted helicase
VNILNQLRAAQDKKAAATSPESLFAYCFGVLAGTDYTLRFQTELETPGPRVPLTRDFKLFDQMADHGAGLIWLQTFGERFRSDQRIRLSLSADIRWTRKPTRIPNDSKDFAYDIQETSLHVSDGKLLGVSEAAWNFEVSGMRILQKWLGYRTAKGAGRAASSGKLLDQIRPTQWEPDWCDELREIVHVLTETEKLRPQGIKLLDQIMEGDLIAADELPQPPDELRKPPSRDGENELFDSDDGE